MIEANSMAGFGESLEEERRHGYLFPIPGAVISGQPTLVKDALTALNKLAGVKFNDACQLFHRPLTAVQKMAAQNVYEAVNESGECPSICGLEALQDMMKSHPVYGEPSTLVPFDAEKLKILRSSGKPKPIESLLPPHVAPLMSRWKTHIELSAQEVQRKMQEEPKLLSSQALLGSHPQTRQAREVEADCWSVGNRSSVF